MVGVWCTCWTFILFMDLGTPYKFSIKAFWFIKKMIEIFLKLEIVSYYSADDIFR